MDCLHQVWAVVILDAEGQRVFAKGHMKRDFLEQRTWLAGLSTPPPLTQPHQKGYITLYTLLVK